MFGLEIIEVALGLALVYFSVSTICSGIYEVFARITEKRATHLEQGIREFLNEPASSKDDKNSLTNQIYNHPVIGSRLEGKIPKKTWIEAKKFSGVLFDILVPPDEAQGSEFVNKLKAEIEKSEETAKESKTITRIIRVLQVPVVKTLKVILTEYFTGDPVNAKIDEVFKGIDLKEACANCYDELVARLKTAGLSDEDYAIAKESLDALVKEGDKFANVKTLIKLRINDEKIQQKVLQLVSKWEDDERITKFRAKLSDIFKGVQDGRLQKALLEKIDKAEGNVAKVRESVEEVFDEAMSDLGKWYVKNLKVVILILSVLITFGFNVDSLELSSRLWNDNDLRAATLVTVQQVVEKKSETWTPGYNPDAAEVAPGVTNPPISTDSSDTNSTVVNPPTQINPPKNPNNEASISELLSDAQTTLDKMETLPVGWNFNGNFWESNFKTFKTGGKLWAAILLKLLGFIMTIAAAALGAPFWFDLLRNLTNIKAQLTKKS